MAKKRRKKKEVIVNEEKLITNFGESRLQYLRRENQDLYKRASKVIGMPDDMIASYPNDELLKKACDGMHSKSNPDARIKEGVVPIGVKFEENMPDEFALESVIDAKFVQINRMQFDEANLQSFLRNINRRYGAQKPVRIVKDISFVAKKYELVTTFTIYFKKG